MASPQIRSATRSTPHIFLTGRERLEDRAQLADRIEHAARQCVLFATERIGQRHYAPKPKPTAETILISDLGEPVLARWRHGAGTSVAWTSDVKNRWGVDWIRWGGYPKFWAQVVRSSMRHKVYDSYDLFAKVADGRALVTVDAIDSGDKFVNTLDTKLQVIDPATNKVTVIRTSVV